MSTLRRIYAPYGHARLWKQTSHLLLDLVAGIAYFTMVITLVSLGAGLVVTVVGIPVLALAVWSGRWVSICERFRARVFLDERLPAWPSPSADGSWWRRSLAVLKDRGGWLGIVYGLLMLAWGIITFTATVVLWTVTASAATFIASGWWTQGWPSGWGWEVKTLAMLGVTAGGWVLAAVLPRAVNALAQADLALMRALVTPNREAALEQRVVQLEESRAAGTDAAAQELRRIERDLHDGAQQRLVSVAMSLGIAKDRLAQADDPAALELVSRAHDEAKQAIVEMRELVRGIHPAVLTDRGLDAAVSALAARCQIPVDVQSFLARRLPTAVETTAYFVVAEALTNVSKHSGARHAVVRLTDRGTTLVVEVQDDGRGGAAVHPAGGLQGLADRVHSVDGVLRLASPVGGPTIVLVELPCG